MNATLPPWHCRPEPRNVIVWPGSSSAHAGEPHSRVDGSGAWSNCGLDEKSDSVLLAVDVTELVCVVVAVLVTDEVEV